MIIRIGLLLGVYVFQVVLILKELGVYLFHFQIALALKAK